MEFYTMRHIRNFFHDITDILLAFVIVAAAIVMIAWRMQVILSYPETVVTDPVVTEETVEEVPAEETANEAPAAETGDKAKEETPATDNAEKAPAAETPEEAPADKNAEDAKAQ